MQECLSDKCFSDITLTLYEKKQNDIPVAKIRTSKALLCNIEYFKTQLKFLYDNPKVKQKKGILKLILQDDVNNFNVETMKLFFELFHEFFDPQSYDFDENKYKTMHQNRFDIVIKKVKDNEMLLVDMIKLSNYFQCRSLQNLYIEIYIKTKSISTLQKLLYVNHLDYQFPDYSNNARHFQFKNLILMLFLRESILENHQFKKLFSFLNFKSKNVLYSADQIVSSSLLWFFDIKEELKHLLGEKHKGNIQSSYDFDIKEEPQDTIDIVCSSLFACSKMKNIEHNEIQDGNSDENNIYYDNKCWVDAYDEKNRKYLIDNVDVLKEKKCLDFRFNRTKILCTIDHQIFRPKSDFFVTLIQGYHVSTSQESENDTFSNTAQQNVENDTAKKDKSRKRKMGVEKLFSNDFYIVSFGGNMNISSHTINFKKHLKIVHKQDAKTNMLCFEFHNFVNVDWMIKFVCHKDCASYTTMSKENLKILENEFHYKYYRKHYMYYEAKKIQDGETSIFCESQYKDFISFEEHKTSRNGKPLKLSISFEFSKKIDNNLFNCLFIFKNNDKTTF